MPTFTRSALLRALDVTLPALAPGSLSSNILSHVLITGNGTTAALHGTDYDVAVSARIPYEGAPFTLCAHGKSLSDVLRAMPVDAVELTALDNHWIQIKGGNAQFRIGGLSPEDYPEQSAPPTAPGFEAPCRTIADLIGKVDHAQSADETRPSLNGALWEVTPDGDEVRIVMVATDGHRLSKAAFLGGVADLDLKSAKIIVTRKIIVARKSMATLVKALDAAADENAKLQIVNVNLYVTIGDVAIRARLLSESYPDYTKVIPKGGGTTRLRLRRSELVSHLKSAATMTTAKTQMVKLTVGEFGLTISAQNPEIGESSVRVDCEIEGPGLVIGVNWKYMVDAVSALDGDTVVVSAVDQYQPILVTPTDDDGTVHVVMPMRI